ncbi:MAG: hypothetical protein ISP01_09535 [Methanobrevibacter arboriphilus]|uniref:Uncharacterized protein n=1 Tax=Methanobrevibacter arboriphilus TaxID=39441 RepID=A0A843AEX8_METAZ|nr:hypothetical protein [Methanobrevibacter arboriphilus]MBF4469632.1 hypothetical protein [Methanobrevibacter arboriphilus]
MAYNFLKGSELIIDGILIGYITNFSPSNNESVSMVVTNTEDVLKSAPATSTEITVDREGVAATPEDDIALLKLSKKGTFKTGSFSGIKHYDNERKALYIFSLGSGTIKRSITYGSEDQLTESYTVRPTSFDEEIQPL